MFKKLEKHGCLGSLDNDGDGASLRIERRSERKSFRHESAVAGDELAAARFLAMRGPSM